MINDLTVMARAQLMTGSKVSLSAFTTASDALDRVNYQDLKLTEQAMNGLLMVLQDSWCLLKAPSSALSQKEALRMQYLWSGSCRRNI